MQEMTYRAAKEKEIIETEECSEFPWSGTDSTEYTSRMVPHVKPKLGLEPLISAPASR